MRNKLLSLLGLAAITSCSYNSSNAISTRTTPISSLVYSTYSSNPTDEYMYTQPAWLQMFFTYIYLGKQNELPFCLEGKIEGKSHNVTGVAFSEVRKMTDTSSSITPCGDEGYLGLIHNHKSVYPSGRCFLSEGDLIRFAKDTRAKVEVVTCPRPNADWSVPTDSSLIFIVVFKDKINKDALEAYRKKPMPDP